jgi:uncharacterized protein (DUF2252 family)
MADQRTAKLEKARPQLRPADRESRGKAIRRAVPREAQAEFRPRPDRADPVALLRQQGETRVAALLPIRYGRMLASPLAYYRGAALPMAADLAGTPATGLIAQLCGDAHLSNFGIFASPERRLVFDINDFDETLPGPWEWDVKRLAASLEIAGQVNGVGAARRRQIVTTAAGHYRLAMRRLAGLGNLDVWYASGDVDDLAARYQAVLSKRERRLAATDLGPPDDERGDLTGLITARHGQPRIVSAPPLVVPAAELASAEPGVAPRVHQLVAGYRESLEPARRHLVGQYQVADLARKVSGVGSVGMRCWIVLLTGRDAGDLLFLQVKQAQPSVLSEFAGRARQASQGERVVAGQRLMQVSSDIFLGWQPGRAASTPGSTTGPGQVSAAADYYIRQLRDWKYSIAIQDMRPATLLAYGALCGRTLARAHARSGDRIALGAYLGRSAAFESAVGEFAVRYARQNELDYRRLQAAVAAGELPAQTGI